MLTSSGRARIAALDVIRGFALCGILLANVQPISGGRSIATSTVSDGVTSAASDSATWLGLFVEQRFMPIFAFLFGIGFALLLRSASERTGRPRVLLLRRLLTLLLIGAAHFLLLWWGDILSTYAVVGLVVLLPSTWLPRRAVAVLGPALILVSLITGDGRISLTAGLFLTGSALVRYGLIDRLPTATPPTDTARHELGRREFALAAGVLAVVAVPLLLWQGTQVSGERAFSFVLAAWGWWWRRSTCVRCLPC